MPALFPDGASIIRLVGAVLAQQHDEWADRRRYVGVEVLAHSLVDLITSNANGKDDDGTIGTSAPDESHRRRAVK